MHLLYENVLKNLMFLWTGNYKGLDAGTEDYGFAPTVWDAIGAASETSGNTIPSSFGPRPPNLINRCLQFEITTAEVEEVRMGFIGWVKQYEQIYYQLDPTRLSTCPLTIHALLHIADSILASGPVWTAWAFPMERYCGSLQPCIRSRRFPYASLNRHVLDAARLTHIKLIYDLHKTLTLRADDLQGFYRAVCIPHFASVLGRGMLTKLIGVLCTRFGGTRKHNTCCTQGSNSGGMGRVRILPDGDTARASSFSAQDDAYEALVDRNARARNRATDLILQTFYGQLQHIYVIHCPPIMASALTKATTLVFAAIRTCELLNNTLHSTFTSTRGKPRSTSSTSPQCSAWLQNPRSGTLGYHRSEWSLSRAWYAGDDEAGGLDDEFAG
ncbi:hypothetical protein BD413DRAFT_607663 [Trametes elegans]|nr:hypothetical protein BD413DRAFT_607663 [Trametes elegans]